MIKHNKVCQLDGLREVWNTAQILTWALRLWLFCHVYVSYCRGRGRSKALTSTSFDPRRGFPANQFKTTDYQFLGWARFPGALLRTALGIISIPARIG
jgi:hypothetical protein